MCRSRIRTLTQPRPEMETPTHAMSTSEHRPKTAPIMVHPVSTAQQTTGSGTTASTWDSEAAVSLRARRRAYTRAPSNEFCPRSCSNCGLSFIPRGFGGEFCSGECRHSFAIMWHTEKRKYQQQQQRQQQQQLQQHQQMKKGGDDRTTAV